MFERKQASNVGTIPEYISAQPSQESISLEKQGTFTAHSRVTKTLDRFEQDRAIVLQNKKTLIRKVEKDTYKYHACPALR